MHQEKSCLIKTLYIFLSTISANLISSFSSFNLLSQYYQIFHLKLFLHDQYILLFLFQICKIYWTFLFPRFWAFASCIVLGIEQLSVLSFLFVYFPQNETSKNESVPFFWPYTYIALWAFSYLGVADVWIWFLVLFQLHVEKKCLIALLLISACPYISLHFLWCEHACTYIHNFQSSFDFFPRSIEHLNSNDQGRAACLFPHIFWHKWQIL